MNRREDTLLRILWNRQTWTTASELATLLSCSVRSIKTTVAQLNDIYPQCILSSRQGYRLGQCPPDVLERVNSAPESAEERRSYILRKLLMEEPEINMECLAGELFVSYSTLTNELPQLRSFLQKYGLGLQIRKSALRIVGNDSDKRRALNQLIYDEAKDFCSSITALNQYFPGLDLNRVRQTIASVFFRHHFYLNEYAMFNLLLHAAITIERNQHGLCSDQDESDTFAVSIPAHIRVIVQEICTLLSQDLQVSFSTVDEYSFGLILYTRGINPSDKESRKMLDSSVQGLIFNICAQVKDFFDISMNDTDFQVRFGLHIENMLIRLRSGVHLRNPQLDLIRNRYPYIYDIGIFIAKIIEKYTCLAVTEDEIGYIALHIGGLIEQANRDRSRIRTVLLYLGYYENGIQLLNKISRTFEDDLLIEDMISSQEQLEEFSDCELLISATALQQAPPIPFVRISDYLNIADVSKVAEALKQAKSRRLNRMMERQLTALFKEELFQYSLSPVTCNEFLENVGSKMEKMGYAESGFYAKLKEREQISSSALGNLAIPHPIDMDARESAIAVAIYPKGIPWGENQVNIIFTLASRKQDRSLFRHIFEFVTEVVLEPNHFKSLMKVNCYEDFIRVLLSWKSTISLNIFFCQFP